MSVALFYHIKFGFSATTHVDNVDLVTKEAAGHIVCYPHTPSYQGTHCTGKIGKTGKMAKKNPCQGKHGEFGNFAKTQGIWFSQVVNSLILKVKEILIFAAKISIFFKVCQVSFVSVIVTNYVNWHRDNLRSGREITGKTQGI